MQQQATRARYDEVAAGYDDGYTGPFWELYDGITRAHLARLAGAVPARVLDLGAGSGKYASDLARLGHAVMLLDLSRAMLEKARERFADGRIPRGAEVQASMDALPYADASFDLVVAEGDPLGYCDEPLRALREMMRVLRPGGRLYVSVDSRWLAAHAALAAGRPRDALDAAERGVARDPYGLPVHAFSSEELATLLADAGFEGVRVAGKVALAHLLGRARLDALRRDAASWEALLAMERRLADEPAGATLATHLHACATKRSRLAAADGVTLAERDGAHYLTSAAEGVIFETNGTGARVFALAAEGRSVEEVVAGIAALHPDVPDEELARDVAEVVEELLRARLLRRR